MPGYTSLSDATSVKLNDANLWGTFGAASANNSVGFFKATVGNNGTLYIVTMNHTIKMIPFVRSAEELFETTAQRESKKNSFKAVINGPTYGLTKSGMFDAYVGSDPVPAAETLQEGRIVYNKKVIGGSKSDMYYIANKTTNPTRFEFGKGAAPIDADAALGNMGPLIINGLPFGEKNTYNPSQPNAPRVGPPGDEFKKHLTQRSNARFEAMAKLADNVGKIAIGYKLDQALLLILLQPHGHPGVSISGLRKIALDLGVDSAVYLDGSDSVMLMLDNNFLVKQGSDKNETNVTGIGFRY